MADATSGPRNVQSRLVEDILQKGRFAFDPSVPQESKTTGLLDFNEFLERTQTLSLLPALNLLIQPDRVPPWLRGPLVSALARLPLRPRGVQHTIEFVLSVHPSTSRVSSGQSTGGVSSISHEALNAASRLLSSPPTGMPPEEWFQGISPQLLSLLLGAGEPGMDKAAAFVIGFGILGRKQFGAPGTPGWKAFVEPVYRHIDPSLTSISALNERCGEEIVSVGHPRVLSTPEDLARALQVLSTLLASHPNPSLTKRLLRPLLLPLWGLGFWRDGGDRIDAVYRFPARNLLKAFLRLTASDPSPNESKVAPSGAIQAILHNLVFTGRFDDAKIRWEYMTNSQADGIAINEVMTSKAFALDDLPLIDKATKSLITLLTDVPELSSEISSLFVALFKDWFTQTPADLQSIQFRHEAEKVFHEYREMLVTAKLVQELIDSFPDKLVTNSTEVLEVLSNVLAEAAAGNSNGEIVAVTLSILNIILTSPSYREKPDIESSLTIIQNSLQSISTSQTDEATTARNLLMLLRFRNVVEEPKDTAQGSVTDQNTEDKKIYRLALSYLTTFDSPPPVRAQGLDLISGLVRSKSAVLDIATTIVLLSSLLRDGEEYIYLRTIKLFVQLSERHPKAVLKDLIARYVDSQEEAELDQRLRFGEVLLQVIEYRYLAFANEIARTVCEGLLFVASRRAYKPETEQYLDKKERSKRKQDELAKRAWDGEVPQLDEYIDYPQDREETLIAQIVEGWESKRGSEDLRMRASALSILASSIEANIAGLPTNILSTTIDACIHILTLELEPEKGILRRSAILVILGFIRALDAARENGKRLTFGLAGQSLEDIRRILMYVEGTDGDGLVKQHAKDVIEYLEAWQMKMITPAPTKGQVEIEELAGLSIRPLPRDVEEPLRPKIEEIE